MKTSHSLPSIFAVVLSICLGAISISTERALAEEVFKATGATNEAGVLPSKKQYDLRLPPGLPGEEIVTERGKKMKVWSSSGPVPVNQQPTPNSISNPGYPAAVIVDDRRRQDLGALEQRGER